LQNVEKLEKVVKDGNCYGAQQMYKSISARFEQFLAVTFYQVYVMCFCSSLEYKPRIHPPMREWCRRIFGVYWRNNEFPTLGTTASSYSAPSSSF